MVAIGKPTDRQYVAAAIRLSTEAFMKGDAPAAICMSGVAQGIAIAKGVDYAEVLAMLVKRKGMIPAEALEAITTNIETLITMLEEAAEKIVL